MTNAVWTRYVAQHVEEWVRWLRNVHIPSYTDLTERFMLLNPHYRPPPDAIHNETDPLLKMLWNEEFVSSLSNKGLQVWANGTVAQFLDELRTYNGFLEIRKVCDFMEANLAWFERVYAFIRADIIQYLRAIGRDI